VWIAFAWVGNAHRAEDYDDGGIPRRLVIILAMALLITLGMVLPQSYTTLAVQAALLYAGLFVLYVLDYLIATAHDPVMRRAVLRIAPVQAILPAAVLISAFFAPSTWTAIVVIIALLKGERKPARVHDRPCLCDQTPSAERTICYPY